MTKKNLKYPNLSPEQTESPIQKAQVEFWGMLSGIPASEIPDGYSAKNVNVIDYRKYFKVRPGIITIDPYPSNWLGYGITELRTGAPFDIVLSYTEGNFELGDQIYFDDYTGDPLPPPLEFNTPYYVVPDIFSASHFSVAASFEDAMNGTYIALTDDGLWRATRGPLYSREQNNEQNLMMFHFGQRVFVAYRNNFTYLSNTINLNETYPSGLSMMEVYEKDIILASASGIYRILARSTTSPRHYFKINGPVPTEIIADVNEDEATGYIYGYRVIYSYSRITGSGNVTRFSNGTELLLESGTSLVPGVEKDYGEVFYTSEISNDHTDPHTIQYLELPATVDEATHFSVYRSKNIGRYSGGMSERLDGIGNNPAFMVWENDYPVAKTFNLTADGTTTLAVAAGSNDVELSEIGDSLQLIQPAGAVITRTITDVDITAQTITVSGAGIAAGTWYAGVGGGQLFICSLTGGAVLCSWPNAPGVFEPTSLGKTVFFHNGDRAFVNEYIDDQTVQVIQPTGEDFTSVFASGAAMIKPAAGNFQRTINLTVRDDGIGTGVPSINDRLNDSLYVPRRFYLPMPNANVVAIESGFIITTLRDEAKYYYTDIADKPQCMGYYRPLKQQHSLRDDITHIVKSPYNFLIFCKNKTYLLPLNSFTETGNTDIGEHIPSLSQANLADDNIGVPKWQTIAVKGSNIWIAMTNEPAIRVFDGTSWSKENYAIDQRTGLDAVQKYYLEKLDLDETTVGFYSKQTGYILWGGKREGT